MPNQFQIPYKCLLIFTIWSAISLSCNKKDFLDKPPSTDLFIPKTLADFRLLFENDEVLGETPMMGEVSADNFYISDSYYESLKSREHNCYTWQDTIYFQNESNVDDWDKPYQQVFYANVVLEGLQKISRDFGGNKSEWENLYGQALFIRAYAFHNLAQVFSPTYYKNISGAENAFGIPLRQSTDIENVPRSSVIDTYKLIVADLEKAIQLIHQPVDINHLNRPSKAAAYALMARVLLTMREYEKALLYADSSLSESNLLINYNGTSPLTPFPFARTNVETLYQSRLLSSNNVLKALVVSDCIVDSNLYETYAPDDLRRSLYYSTLTGPPTLKGGYTGSIFLFTGLANDEMYLIKAECLARKGSFLEAMDVLNALLVERWKTGTFIPLTAANSSEALDIILAERRKELSFRGLRWSDLRRLNKEGRNITVIRNISGVSYSLLPNSRKYVLPLPFNVIDLGKVSQYERN